MITNFTNQLTSPFEIIGDKLRIHYNETEVVREESTSYNYTTAIVDKNADKDTIIEAIIASKYSTGQELATINNREEKPDEYTAYQEFRTFAKNLATEWMNKE